MIIVEYEAKALLKARGLPVPLGLTADTPEAARRAAEQLGAAVVLKAQVPSGGRMKAGGVRFAGTPAEARAIARALLGRTLRGFRVGRLLIEGKLTIDGSFRRRHLRRPRAPALLLTSAAGGIDVESVGAGW